jgi:hypothetical protein
MDTKKNNNINEKKVTSAINKLMTVLNKTKLNIPEIILAYGNLGYHIGASIAGFNNDGPGIDELKKEYYTNPTIDVGFMLQGLTISSWVEDFIKNPKLSKLAEENKKQKEQGEK